jgi:hypothetical protein
LFVLLILVELLTITVYKLYFLKDIISETFTSSTNFWPPFIVEDYANTRSLWLNQDMKKTEVDKTLRDEQSRIQTRAFLCRPDCHSQNNCRVNNRMANFSLHEFYRFWKKPSTAYTIRYCEKFWNTMAYLRRSFLSYNNFMMDLVAK